MCDPSTLYRAAWSRPTRRQRSLGTSSPRRCGGLLTFPPRNRVSCAALALWPGIKLGLGRTWIRSISPGMMMALRRGPALFRGRGSTGCAPRHQTTATAGPGPPQPQAAPTRVTMLSLCSHAAAPTPTRVTTSPSLSHAAAPPAPWLPSRHSFTHTRLPYQDR